RVWGVGGVCQVRRGRVLRADATAAIDRDDRDHGGDVHPHGAARRAPDAHVPRVAGQSDLQRGGNPQRRVRERRADLRAGAACPAPIETRGTRMNRAGWGASVAVYASFAAAVFIAQGPQPLLGADHISYIKLADTIYAACPDGRYWRELNSVRTFSVLLAWMQGYTGSYVL